MAPIRLPPKASRLAAWLGGLPRPARVTLYAATTAGLLFLCLAPTEDLPGAGLVWDKWEHVVGWFLLTVAGYLLAPDRPRAVTLYAILFGAGVELLQATMGFGRHGDLRDLIADTVGVLLAVAASLLVRDRRRRAVGATAARP